MFCQLIYTTGKSLNRTECIYIAFCKWYLMYLGRICGLAIFPFQKHSQCKQYTVKFDKLALLKKGM